VKTVFHFSPRIGWLNDPNGLIDHGGRHHFFYQHNPRELAMTDMCWGHASSPDLITWTEHPVALAPGPRGSYDGDGCWSGCAVDDGSGVVAVYSGNNGGIQLPCVARAVDEDLLTWVKSPANPVVDSRPPLAGMTDMRDHSVRRDGSGWRQVLAAGIAGKGALVGYSSTDLTSWSWDGIVLDAGTSGLPGQVWECPDVFDVDGTAVAVISVVDGDRRPGPVIWVTGQFDGPRIIAHRWGLLDHGDRLYAPQSYNDRTGRRIMFAWLLTQLDPAAQGQPSIGVASLPRMLSVVDGRLHQQPATEIHGLRGEPTTLTADPRASTARAMVPPTAALEVRVTCTSTADLLGVRVEFDDGGGHQVGVELSSFAAAGRTLDHGDWRDDITHPRTATVILDSGIVETFLDDGRAAATTDVSISEAQHLRVYWTGRVPTEMTAWALNSPSADPDGLTAQGDPRVEVTV